MLKRSIWLITVLTFFCVSTAVSAEPVFRIVYNIKENLPRIMDDGTAINWSKPGITIELLRMVEKQIGVTFQFIRVPWKRGLYMVEHGAADAAFHASFKVSRAEYGVYPARDGKLDPARSIYKMTYALYARKGSGVSWDGKTIRNISGPIGTVLSFAIADDLRKMGHEVEEEASVGINLDKLAAGRISAYADMETIVDNVLNKLGPRYKTIEKLHPPLREKTYYLLVSKTFAANYPQLTERIWDAVRDVQQTDAYREMLKKYQDQGY